MKTIPYSRQLIDKKDIREVTRTLKTPWLTQGPKVRDFETALVNYTGANFCVALSSGTAALHLVMKCLDVKEGDKIITSPITFSASANCGLYVGATPVFIDIDDQTYHLDPQRLKDYLKVPSQRKGVKVIVAVHFMGTVSDMAEIKAITRPYGIYVVEDAAHALGAKYEEKKRSYPVGSCRYAQATVLSFHPIKHITTGEGGAILTQDKDIFETALRLRHHGIVRDPENPWMYDIRQLGFNYRITDFQCSLGLSQLKKLDRMVTERRELVERYNQAFASIQDLRLPLERRGTYASYHLYVVRVLKGRRNALGQYLRAQGIATQINYIPVHLLTIYKELGFKQGDFPVAEQYFDECLSLPLYAGLTWVQQDKVIRHVKKFFDQAKGF